jgi:hypothetical protein
MEMATLNERVAEECFYALPRDGKTVEGPSARLAEIVTSAWGNCRACARVVDEGAEFLTRRVCSTTWSATCSVTMEVRRRITGKNGRRYSSDMIGVTGNAACSIALCNAVFRGIPRAFWIDIYDAARKAAVGDAQTLANKRAHMFAHFLKLGATREAILAAINVQGEEDIGLDELATLKGIATAIKDGDTTVGQAFPPQPKAGAATNSGPEDKKGVAGLAARVANAKGGAAKAAEAPESTGGDGEVRP